MNMWNIIIKSSKIQNTVANGDNIRCSAKVSTFPYVGYIALR